MSGPINFTLRSSSLQRCQAYSRFQFKSISSIISIPFCQQLPKSRALSSSVCITDLRSRRIKHVLCSQPWHNTIRASRPRRSFADEGSHSSRSSSSQGKGEDQQPSPTTKPLAKTIEAASETATAVKSQLRSSLNNLRPHENIYNLPNFLTLTRLIAAPTTAYLLLHDQHTAALALFAYAGITDLVDGWLARKWKLQTVAGSVIDPMADKALMIILTVTLAVKGALPLYLATLILGRDASLALAAIYYRYASLPSPKTFLRYWDFSLPSAEVHPTTVSKYNTFLQLTLIGSTLALPVLALDTSSAAAAAAGASSAAGLVPLGLKGLQWVVAGTTAWSGLSYAVLERAVTILGPDEALKKRQGARGRAIIGVTFGGVVLAAGWLAWREGDVGETRDAEK